MKLKLRVRVMVFVAAVISASGCATSGQGGHDKYIFYLHGSVDEEVGSTEKYEAAVDAIGQSAAKVVSEVRDDTNPKDYAEKLKKQVNDLLAKGVPAKNITISGFSKGAIIALATAGEVQNSEVNYVLLAGCSDFLNNKYGVDPNVAVGRILSIYDSDDHKFGSCSGVIEKTIM